jgi:hypothetical protein
LLIGQAGAQHLVKRRRIVDHQNRARSCHQGADYVR